MSLPAPLVTLYERGDDRARPLPLPPELAARYGELAFPVRPDRPYVISNFVETLDGVVSLNVPGQEGGKEISGHDPHDRMVMGLLRATVDAVVVGAGVLRASPTHRWTPDYVFPRLADEFQRLRAALGKDEPPLNVIVTASGAIDPGLPVFRSDAAPALIVTTEAGQRRLAETNLAAHVSVAAPDAGAMLAPATILAAIQQVRRCDRILSEAGPHLFGAFLAAGLVDELFLTLAPQIAGRDRAAERPALVAGVRFAPEAPLWSDLISVKRGDSHLFLRYALPAR
ncbi:MAG TPA: dihydrofolate reductase family protein [Thermomicrobiaceae bacterium]|nr:dihydrofolate reductase family protein [Thermomicrobiaceae bacterium]